MMGRFERPYKNGCNVVEGVWWKESGTINNKWLANILNRRQLTYKVLYILICNR